MIHQFTVGYRINGRSANDTFNLPVEVEYHETYDASQKHCKIYEAIANAHNLLFYKQTGFIAADSISPLFITKLN